MTTIHSIKRSNGIAGQVQYTATVQYEGEEPRTVSFVGNTFGGPVVMITGPGIQTFVSHHERFGPFGAAWVRNFFAAT